VDSLTGIGYFRIYRSDSAEVAPALYDSTTSATTSYTDAGLKNGKSYSYQVSSVSTAKLEGYRSAKVTGVPNLYSVVVNDDAKYTKTRSVNVGLTGASNTRHVMISEDSLFSGAAWQVFSGSKSFTLSAGDGTKYIYAKFKDQDGNETKDSFRDEIILDTQAGISAVTETTRGQPKSAGEIIHFTVTTGEPEGDAKVDLGSIKDIQLYDDGSHGDAFVDDGTYELDYFVSNDVEVKDAVVTGKFTDAAGNQAPTRTATGKVTILKGPDPVTLFSPFAMEGSHSSVGLGWSESNEADFASYKIYRSLTGGVSLNSTLVATLTNKSTSSFTDTALAENTVYYYRVFVFDLNNLSGGSNEDSGRTNIDAPPDTVQLLAPSERTFNSLTLFWTQSKATDFQAYQLYRGNSPAVDSGSSLMVTINNKNTTTFTDTGLDANTTYYYRLYVVDRGGKSSASNSVSGTTKPYPVPEAVTLFAPSNLTENSMTLFWTQSPSPNFSAYQLFRGNLAGVDSTDELVASVTSQTTLTYTDTCLTSDTEYYYRLYVYNTFGNGTGSNQVTARTLVNQPPQPAVLSTPNRVDSTTLSLTWTKSEEKDFASYRIYRSTSAGVDTSDQLIVVINQADNTDYSDQNLTTGQTYFYRIFVFDREGLSSGSNEVSAAP
jgi:fibronectin type 3 domain-containing protein